MLNVKNLGLKFGDRTILHDINFNVKSGEILSITGPSGCGKSTLLKSILGISGPQSGIINLNGKDITHLPLNKRDAVMVFQDFSLFPHMTMEQNLFVGTKDEELVGEIIKYFDLESLSGKYPFQMSGGEQQRVTLARAIVNKPKLLLLDEPFASIDNITLTYFRERVYDLLTKFDVTTLMVTHDLVDVFEMSERCIVMKNAHIIQLDTLENIYYNPKTDFVAALFGMVFEYEGKKYRPEEIEVYESFVESSQEVKVLNKKFNLLYNELLVRSASKTMEPFIVHDCHRRDIGPGDTAFIVIKKRNLK